MRRVPDRGGLAHAKVRLVFAVFGALLVGMAGCAGDGEGTPARDRAVSPAPFEDQRPCPADESEPSLPEDAGCITTGSGDADGDGIAEELISYARVGLDRLPREWFVRVQRSDGSKVDVLGLGERSSYFRVVGAADIQGDGADEWFVITRNLAGHGTSWRSLNLFVVVSGRVMVVTSEGKPLDLYVGGVSRTGEGIACGNGELQLLRAEAQNVKNTRWDTSTRFYSIDGARARFLRRDTGDLSLSDYNDPDLDPFYGLACGDVVYRP